jgi:N6-adenosine-specific RNA methylase IME4
LEYQVMPPLSDAEYQELKADIAARGVMVPLEYDEAGNVLDGHHRERACKDLGITDWPRIVRHGLDEAGKRLHARQLNLARRHLGQEAKRNLIEDQLRETPQRSNRAIAAGLGVDDTTVGDARRRLEATAGIPQLERTVGADGKYRPTGYRYIDDSASGQRSALETAKEIRAEKAETRRAERIERIANISKGNAPLGLERTYPVILADPPWRFEHPPMGGNRVVENHYPTLTLEEICALPVKELATEDAILFLWATSPKLAECMKVIEAWGFNYRTDMVWVKDSIGMGYYARQRHEALLIATRGDIPPPRESDRPPSVLYAPRREHSRKPDETYALVERMYPELAKIELYARHARPGWERWGNQAGVAA